MILKAILLLIYIYQYYSLEKFTIESEGKNIVTTKVSNKGDCSSIAITQTGVFIQYRSDSSIISSNKVDPLSTTKDSKYFMCQFSNDEVILVRDTEMIEIKLDENGKYESSLEKKEIENTEKIIYLQCNLGKYIITYLNDDKNKYYFDVYSSSYFPVYSFNYDMPLTLITSSCLLIYNSQVLCINTFSSEIKYYYHILDSSPITPTIKDPVYQNIDTDKDYEIKGTLIKYLSNDEILICLNEYLKNPREDINLKCHMAKISQENGNDLTIEIKYEYIANEKVTDNIDYCQIEKLTSSTSNIYASICLTYYYRTTYLLSIFKYENDGFKEYYTSLDYKDIQFSLLNKTIISITPFQDESFGIFFKDIDDDSMILMFFPKCGILLPSEAKEEYFNLAPKGDSCCKIEDASCTSDNYYFDECSHSFLEKPSGYSVYERNQLCKIKKIGCDTAQNYKLDDNNNFGSYECWDINNPPDTYYYDSTDDLFKKCFRTCLTCHGEGTEADNNCIICKENFFKLEDKVKQCHHKDEPLDKYFFKDNLFYKCRKECLTCTEYGNIDTEDTNETKDTKCTKCLIDNYWPQVDKPSNCIQKDSTNIKRYFAFISYQSWEKCFDGCESCTELGTSIYDTKCNSNSCSNGYTVTEDNSQNCFKKNSRYNNYFYDASNNIFKKCYEACLQCDSFGNNLDTKCLKCKESENFYEREDKSSMCLKYDSTANIDSLPEKYFFDPNSKKFKKCQEGCLKCLEQINTNENDTQCLSCDTSSGYYPFENNHQNCYPANKKGYYLLNIDGLDIIKKCPEGCISCIYDSSLSTTLKVKCKECDNELRFYELEERESGRIINPEFKECRTLRPEKIINDIENNPYNQAPPQNTILSSHTFNEDGITKVVKMFKYCAKACSKCTQLYESVFKTHCQARQCNPNYAYILNYEDICYRKTNSLAHHFLYDNSVFKPCYESCKTCSKSGTKQNNNCNECREGYKFHPNIITHYKNCIFDCLAINNYFYLDEDNNDEYTCVDKCPENYPYLQPLKKQCLKSCENEETLKYSRDWICVPECPEGTEPNNFDECVSVSKNCIKSELESKYILNDINETTINEFIVNYCHDYSYTSQQITVIRNKLDEYKIFIYKNMDCIDAFFEKKLNFPDLSVCYDELKKKNNIYKNQDLIIMVMNIYNPFSNIRVEYKIYNSITCQELDLNNCSIKNISTYIDMDKYFSENQIKTAKKMYDKGINVYNRKDPFFTDICYEFTSDNDRDIILEDRVDEFYQNVTNICEYNCITDADFEKKNLKCICELKTTFMEEINKEDDEKELGFGIGAISIQVIKCAKKAFLWDYFKTNIGSYTSLVLIVAEIPVIFYFIKFGLSQVKVFLIPFMGANPPKNTLNKKNQNQNGNGINEEEDEYEEYEEEEKENDNIVKDNIKDNNKINELNNINNETKYSKFENISNKDKSIKEEEIKNLQNPQKNSNDKNSDDFLLEDQYEFQKKINKKKNYDIYKEIKDYDDLNDIELFDAVTFDKRNYCQFYWDELKRTQPIIYSFISYTPLTPKFFKILLFIFNTIICFEFNAFFYSKSYISDKYFYFRNDFSWYINHIYDRILYVCICTIFLNLFIRVLTNSKKKMQMWIKREKDPEKFNKEIINMTNNMNATYIVFMIVQGLFMFFFWIYLSCFCNCYKNNEIEWFVTSLICLVLIQIWYFISTFIVASLRLIGIKFRMESCYNISLCLSYD